MFEGRRKALLAKRKVQAKIQRHKIFQAKISIQSTKRKAMGDNTTVEVGQGRTSETLFFFIL